MKHANGISQARLMPLPPRRMKPAERMRLRRRRQRKTARPVELTLSPRLSGRRLYIEGTGRSRTAPLIAFEVTPVDPGVDTVEGTTAVRDSAFSEVVELTGWPPGEMEVWVAFQTILGTDASQPDHILELYGPMGERMVGAQVQQAGTLRRVETARTIRLR
jgi:hypothetical protein